MIQIPMFKAPVALLFVFALHGSTLALQATQSSTSRNILVIRASANQNDDCKSSSQTMRKCASSIPNYASVSDTEIASCLCCVEGKWNALSFDDSTERCLTYLQNQSPLQSDLIAAFEPMKGFCAGVGNVQCDGAAAGSKSKSEDNAPAPALDSSADVAPPIPMAVKTITGISPPSQSLSLPPPPSSSLALSGTNAGTTTNELPPAATGQDGCMGAKNILAFCSTKLPNIQSADEKEIAGCLCYNNKSYVPEYFDAMLHSCLAWAATQDAAYYDAIKDLDGFCQRVGPVGSENVNGGAAAASSAATGTDDSRANVWLAVLTATTLGFCLIF